MMFAAPPEQALEWSDAGVQGASRFLNRFWKAVQLHVEKGRPTDLVADILNSAEKDLRRKTHQTIFKVSDDIGRRYTFNTAIAASMELLNAVTRFRHSTDQSLSVEREALNTIVVVLSPIVPHICHELWELLGHDRAVVDEAWPIFDEKALWQEILEIVVQVNGKLRSRIAIAADASEEAVKAAALNDENVRRFIGDRKVKKTIVVPGRLVNIVV